jgi:tRNA(Ile)-lysidine synthase
VAGEVAVPEIPAEVPLAGDWRFTIEPVGKVVSAADSDAYEARLDAESLQFPLVVRGRVQGERFEPAGMDGRSRRLSDAMIDWKIPQRLRARWPLLLSRGKVAWVPGYRVGAGFTVGEKTADSIRVKLIRR